MHKATQFCMLQIVVTPLAAKALNICFVKHINMLFSIVNNFMKIKLVLN